jgi:hypothetical protein
MVLPPAEERLRVFNTFIMLFYPSAATRKDFFRFTVSGDANRFPAANGLSIPYSNLPEKGPYFGKCKNFRAKATDSR